MVSLLLRISLLLLNRLYLVISVEVLVLLLALLKAEGCSCGRIHAPCVPLIVYRDLFLYPLYCRILLLRVGGGSRVDCSHIEQIGIITSLFPLLGICFLIWYNHLLFLDTQVAIIVEPFWERNRIKLFQVFVLIFNLLLDIRMH